MFKKHSIQLLQNIFGTVTKRRRKNLLSNFVFDVSLGNERQVSSENTVTWEAN